MSLRRPPYVRVNHETGINGLFGNFLSNLLNESLKCCSLCFNLNPLVCFSPFFPELPNWSKPVNRPCRCTFTLYCFTFRPIVKYLYVLIKQKLSCIPHEQKQTIFTVTQTANLFVHERLNIAEAYSELSATSKMELFAKIANGKKPLTIFAKSTISDGKLGSEYVSTSVLGICYKY